MYKSCVSALPCHLPALRAAVICIVQDVIHAAIMCAPAEEERAVLKEGIDRFRKDYDEMVFVSFTGDEMISGGCIAAGRGVFHINSHGGAEPCPFSPYSDINVRDTSLREALKSKLLAAK